MIDHALTLPAEPTAPNAQAGAATRLTAVVGIAWLGYLLLAPTVGFGWIPSWHNEQRAIQVGLLACTAALLPVVLRAPAWRRALPRVHPLVFAAFLLGIVSALLAPYRFAAFAEIGLHAALLGVVLWTATAVRVLPQAGRLVSQAALLIGAAHVLATAVRYVTALSMGFTPGIDVLMLGYANPRFPTALHALLMPFIAHEALSHRRRSIRILAVLTLSLLWTIDIALETRAIGFACLLALPVTLAVCSWRQALPLARAIIVTAVAGALLYLLLFHGLPALLDIAPPMRVRPEGMGFLSKRDLLYRSTWEAVRAAPLLGIGPMQFAAIPGVWSAHPHNWVLQLAAEWGLVATLAILGALGALVAGVRRSCTGAAPQDRTAAAADPSNHRSSTLVAGAMAVAIALCYGLVDGNLVMPVSQSVAALVLGVVMGEVAARPAQAGGSWPLVCGTVLAGALGVSAFTASSVDAQPEHEAARQAEKPGGTTLWPRFWTDGMIPQRLNPPDARVPPVQTGRPAP